MSRASLEVSDSVEDSTSDEDDDLAKEIEAILLALMLMRGSKVYGEGILIAMLAGIDISKTSKFNNYLLDDESAYVKSVVKSFNKDTSSEISKVIASAISEGLGAVEIKRKLSDFKSEQAFRVDRLSGNEAWRASEKAGLKAMTQINTEVNEIQSATTYKIWNIQPSACPICVDYAGATVKVNEQFFGGIDAPPAHVTCRCKLSYSIKKAEPITNNIAGKDPDGIYAPNGRYLGRRLGDGFIELKNPTDKVSTIVQI